MFRIRSLPRGVIAALLVVGILVLGYLDYRTGYELGFFVFYIPPVMVAAWYLGRVSGVGSACLSIIVWAAADHLSGNRYSAPVFAVWNTLIRLIAFLIVSESFAKIRQLLLAERETVEELRRARAEINVLEGLLPICAQCKKIRDAGGSWTRIESYITTHSNAQFTHGYCPDCARKALEDAGLNPRR